MTPPVGGTGGGQPSGTAPGPMGKTFAAIAFVEAATWAALLAGMFLKYVTETTDLGVTIAGNLHGYAFLVYVVVTITASIRLRWGWGTIALALLAAIPPLVTIPLEIWMRRTGRLAPRRHLPRTQYEVSALGGRPSRGR